MSFTALIPARLASTRLPGKPLADIAGVPMVVHVARRAAASGATCVVVAADSTDIVEACAVHGVQAVLTREDHGSGSDRIAEACDILGLPDDALVVNVQGDEPLIDPGLIARTALLLPERPDCVMGTAAHVMSNEAEFRNPNVVKVVLDAAGRALYFSRAPIPCWRDANPPGAAPLAPAALRHIGIYSYRAGFLRRFPTLSTAPVEHCEALEQLRVLWHGERIAVHITDTPPGVGVDTPQDLERVRRMLS